MKQIFDIVFVGAGPASLAGALHLKRLLNARHEFRNMSVAILEKAPNAGDHTISGASLDPTALADLIPDYKTSLSPILQPVTSESMGYLTKRMHLPFPLTPPPMSNKGCYIVSLSELAKRLASLCEAEGVEIYTGEPADDLIIDDLGTVRGVRVKEKGLNKEGERRPNYLEPTEVEAKVIVLGEGSRGHLTRRLGHRLGLDEGRIPQGHAIGIKEVWEIDEKKSKPGRVIHTMGYPLGLSAFGGGFMYHYKDRLIAIGLVVGLDYHNPSLHPFELFQRWKMHPYISRTIDGGRVVSYGARTLSEGGWYCIPRLYGDGFLIIGEAAGFLNAFRLKGIHLAMKSGMLAAETIVEAVVRNDFSASTLRSYEERIGSGCIKRELWRTRNFHQGFHRGIVPGALHTGFQMITGGRGLFDHISVKEDWRCMDATRGRKVNVEPFMPDGRISFDKLTSVFASGTKHDEDQPCHLKIDDISICNTRCEKEYGNPCRFFCPANVYEMVEDEHGKKVLQLNPTNCLHCKTCDVKDPYNIITWVPPEGGGGPNYKGM